ncbi:hypothetical protein EUX98_g5825 [Antrodiella citrinella]|uniref:DH domain-containing protein n=1 Tax=Antrodiella citrinella TaxID=2447956 RepID=A0A4S4MRI2_9APHY|nr:hypothetical protein EUX98_g5825 [Antrodiella citrinella]
MSKVAAISQPSPPGDEELAALYNQVLIGFAEEPSPTSDQSSQKLPSPGDRDYSDTAIYAHYANDGVDTSRSSHHSMNGRSTKQTLPPQPSSPRGLPVSPTQGRVRPLPRIPGSVPPPPPLPAKTALPMMPDPRSYYQESQQEVTYMQPVIPDRPPRTPTDNSYNNGRYAAHYNGIQTDYPPPSTYYRPDTASSDTAETPTVNMHMPMPMPMSDANGASPGWRPPTGQSDVSARYQNSRPSTVSSQTPRGPVYENGYDDPPYRSPDSFDDMYASPDSYVSSEPYHQDTIANHRRVDSNRSFQQPSLYPGIPYPRNQDLGMSHSAGSGSSSQFPPSGPGVHRNPSAATNGTTATRSSLYSSEDGTLGVARASSSLATTLDRGNSTGSYQSDWTQPKFPQPHPQPQPTQSYYEQPSYPDPGPSQPQFPGTSSNWRNNDIVRTLEDIKRPLDPQEDYDEDAYFDEEDPSEDGDDRFFNPALLSHIAVRLKDKREALPALPIQEELTEEGTEDEDWSASVAEDLLKTLPASEVSRQSIIHKVISKEKQYLRDLDTVESLFIRPLRTANPPIIRPAELDDFIEDVFGNILDLRECNRRLLEVMYVRQREQAPIIHGIGDIFLDAATEFRLAYPIYVGHLPVAEKRVKDEVDHNADFRRFLEQAARSPDARRLELKHFLNRPSEHLQKYPVTLEAICNETTEGNPDAEFLKEAIEAIKKLQSISQLWTFQSAMGKGPTGKLDWHNLVSEEVRLALPKQEAKRQNIIFELIKGEMDYVKDLENIETMYVAPLREMDPPIVSRERLPQFLQDVFHNFAELHAHHRKMLNTFQEIQRDEHPLIRSVTAAVYDAVLNFREAYMEYIPNYPIAAYRIDEEMANNVAFKDFVESCTRHPDAHRLDMKNFINRPIPRLLRYELLLKNILDETPEGHEDKDTIPQVLEVIKALGKETEPGVVSAKQKVEVWRYNSNLVFKPGEAIDMDLLNENRSLIHTGKLLRQPDTGFEWNSWTELFVLLFDNYLVMTKPKERDGITKYHVYRRPIPLDLLTLANFTDPPTQRSTSILRTRLRGEKHDVSTPTGSTASPETATDSRAVYPCTIHHNGRLGGLYTVFAESLQARNEWKQKLDEAIGLRKVVQESNKVFEVETLSADTFIAPALGPPSSNGQAWNHENAYTGKVTCSVPFTTSDGRGLVAIGCAEGVWIGFRHDSRSMRRVLHLKMVTQCAMLEEFGIFLVLADKSLFAYHIEALVPSSPQSAHTSQTPQKLSGSKDVHFFSVGNLNNRTLVIYMKKKGMDSVFRVLEPVLGKINERTKAPPTFGSRFGLRPQRSDWFRVYRDFFLPSESYDLIFLKAKIVILCTKGFEIMDLIDFKSVTIPLRDDPRLEKLAKRCESCRPMGMFRSSKDEFLLCYNEFGLYVDRHGEPCRSIQTIEWEGTAEHVAWHPPYVLLFDSRFIEIRHVETGRLAQIIPGNDMRCIWDGRGTTSMPPPTPGSEGWHEGVSQEPRVHGVMNVPETTTSKTALRSTPQHVFELIPTIPLYLPGSLSSPSQSTYFAQSNSPPHSPQLNPAIAWSR